MMPPSPTATPTFGLAKATRCRVSAVPLVRVDHVVPFVVRRIVPPSPTTTPALPLVRSAPRSPQCFPPAGADADERQSVLRRIVPASPTTIPVLRFAKHTPLSVFPCGTGFCQNQPDGPSGGGVNGIPSSEEQP